MERADINEIEMKRKLKTKKINEAKSQLFVKINKIGKPLAKLSRRKR